MTLEMSWHVEITYSERLIGLHGGEHLAFVEQLARAHHCEHYADFEGDEGRRTPAHDVFTDSRYSLHRFLVEVCEQLDNAALEIGGAAELPFSAYRVVVKAMTDKRDAGAQVRNE
jgi:hypothetical protein